MSQNISVHTITGANPLFPNFREVWHHRGLLWMLIQRNIKARYKQTVLGSTWIVIQPLLLAGMLTVIVGIMLHAPSDGVPYALFAFTGSSIWNVFQRAMAETSQSLAASGNIIQKVYFPRVLIPLASALTTVLEFAPVFVTLFAVTFAYGRFPGLPVLAMPLFLLLAFLLAFGVGLWVTTLDAIYRDLRLIIPSILQLLLFACPVMYAVTVVPARWRGLYELNPLVAMLQGFRWSLIEGVTPPSILSLVVAAISSIAILISGFSVFAKLEQFAVDRI